MEEDLVSYSEHRLNCRHKDNRNGFLQMFRGREAYIQSIAAHNVHKNVGRIKECGTSMLLYGPLLYQYHFEQSGKDKAELGRWVIMVFQVSEVIKNSIVCGQNSF